MFRRNIIEGFGDGARAQISSNQGDSTLFGGSNSQVMAANAFASSGYQSQMGGANGILSQTTPQQYQQLTSKGSGNGWGSTGVPNYAGHSPARPIHQPEFSPHIQQQFLKYENQLHRERQHNKEIKNRLGWSRRSGSGLIAQLNDLIEQIFRFIIEILNILIGWLF